MTTSKKNLNITFRILLPPTIMSIIVFATLCLISYLLTRENKFKFKIGFPYKFYEQFRLSKSDENNWGWTPANLIVDIVIIWLLSLSGYFIWLLKFYNPKKR